MEWYALLLIPILFILIVIVRTIQFKPNQFPEMKKKHEIDEKRVVESLSKMIQYKTISSNDKSNEDENEFTKFRAFIKERYPLILEHAEYSEHERGMLFKIKGESAEFPTVLMSHYDVVPVNGDWVHDPFSGLISDTTVYGRGALDTKSNLNAVVESVEYILSKDKKFKNDLYLAFSGDEEISGPSAKAIVKYLKSCGVKPYMVLDEGGAIVSKMFPGVKEKTAVIGIAEKGYLNITLTAISRGGHASTPPKNTPLTDLSKAVVALNNSKAFKLKMTDPVRYLFNAVAPHSKSLPIRILFANLWLFMPVVKMIAKMSGGELLSMFKTTQAFTQANGSEASNVLPSKATIGINYRLRPFETSEDVVRKIKKIIKNPNIDVAITSVSEATTVSEVDEAFRMVQRAINQVWSDVLVAPYLMVATTDSREYHEICEHVYKFCPMDVSKDDLAKIHGIDEDITIENVVNGVNFYINLLEQL
ncbi:MAG: peptidase M20 [Tenericutes bacterium HGW-Tenericutes-2]|jgi:carboxypeptidase PM20D1|nr:MAG: peptidase M20 [Tenericutes bacterium HGW-Tenericutes-2]